MEKDKCKANDRDKMEDKMENNMRRDEVVDEAVIDRNVIFEIVENDWLTSYFQPIYSSKDGQVYGYEALARVHAPLKIDPATLFRHAKLNGITPLVDVQCRENAIKKASLLGIAGTDAMLFINICPETIMDTPKRCEMMDAFVEQWEIPRERIVLEITEESVIDNYSLFNQTIDFFKDRGYKIAIDDFGTGYGGLKMLSLIEPCFVKIDRHFISKMDKDLVKYNLVDAIATACHRLGIKVIAEGVERQEELEQVMNMGIGFLQGFLFQKPSPNLETNRIPETLLPAVIEPRHRNNDDNLFIGDIAEAGCHLDSKSCCNDALVMFNYNPNARMLPVVSNGQIVGTINRNTFMERHVVGKYGYGMSLNARKKMDNIMERQFLAFEYNTPLEDVAQRLSRRGVNYVYDDLCVTKNGKYYGTTPFSVLLGAITSHAIALAKNSNPLTGLAGNSFIQREITKRLSQGIHFDTCYIDLDHFKPYNDNYGFEKGDVVIKALGSILEEVIKTSDSSTDFVGHIGGDDFIVITHPKKSMLLCQRVVESFKSLLPLFHGGEDFSRGYYLAKNRKGICEQFPLLSISIGIVSTEINKINSYPELASLASEIKKAAKREEGFSIIRDRRLL
ncbi:MAG: EAL and GGDEF domain-containing protein [Nitrospirae bacterium]|nr:EAL and GGDEF domain-containing protein [Nitrospirota bacterium]